MSYLYKIDGTLAKKNIMAPAMLLLRSQKIR